MNELKSLSAFFQRILSPASDDKKEKRNLFVSPLTEVELQVPDSVLPLIDDTFGSHVYSRDPEGETVSCRIGANRDAIRQWAVEHAGLVKVVSPQELSEEVREEIRRAAELYGVAAEYEARTEREKAEKEEIHRHIQLLIQQYRPEEDYQQEIDTCLVEIERLKEQILEMENREKNLEEQVFEYENQDIVAKLFYNRTEAKRNKNDLAAEKMDIARNRENLRQKEKELQENRLNLSRLQLLQKIRDDLLPHEDREGMTTTRPWGDWKETNEAAAGSGVENADSDEQEGGEKPPENGEA